MTNLVITLLAIATSAVLLGVLGWRDPKRLRTSRSAAPTAATPRARRWLGWSIPIPGVVLVLAGAWHPLLIWFGAVCTLGWLATALFALKTR